MNKQTAVFAAGCFWCVEAVFQRVKGVESVVSGYTGGFMENPTYEQVSTGNTGHAEATKVVFDPAIVSYKELINIFFLTHDPTTLNKQGNDEGTQYRSAIFYLDDEQKNIAEKTIQEISEKKLYNDPIVTQIEEFKKFYSAEDYHQNFYNNNENYPYCRVVISPKLSKFRKEMSSYIQE
jgi:peptide-methionine (S)-S-oxide reductase